jgi:hypothetical protein
MFLLEKVGFVEKENKGHLSKYPVVDEGGENVARFHNSIGLPVFQQYLVVLADGRQKENAIDRFEALIPFLALKSLTT